MLNSFQSFKPSGFQGKFYGRLMNKYNTNIYRDYITDNVPQQNARILDIGCGGGSFLKFLYNYKREFKLFGIDHSKDMIKLASRINKKGIDEKTISIELSSVDSLPHKDESLDMVTALQTVQFWPNTKKAFKEINRVLRDEGEFLIINRYPKENSNWWNFARIKGIRQFHTLLKEANFERVKVSLKYKPGWIIVRAYK